MTLDFNDAPEQREFDLISTGTVVTLRITLRPGGAGDGGWLKRSADGGCEMLDIEYVLLEGPFAKRKFWENLVVGGTTDRHAKAADISRGRLRAMLESARGVLPDDKSDEARQKRRAEYADLDGLSFIGKIGVKKGERRGNGENYPDKNILDQVITPDKKEWHIVEQAPRAQNPPGASTPAATVAPFKKPAWAS